jgi:GntR family transcriptional regulator
MFHPATAPVRREQSFAAPSTAPMFWSYIRHMTSDKPEIDDHGSGASAAAPVPVGFRPLYRQVKDAFVKRMVDGVWPAGFLLPSEGQLAAEIGVSQGTVRKALDELAGENLLVRQQGRGTFVAQHDEKRILFQFFKLVPDDGIARFPESVVLEAAVHTATATEREQLGLEAGAKVARVRRMRAIDNVPMIIETLSLPDAMFPRITDDAVPNSLYAFYAERYGVTIAHAREKLKAVALTSRDAEALGKPPGHPALMVQRLALSLDARPVEWRVSLCLTDDAHYLSFMR